MVESNHDYWTRRAAEESSLALKASRTEAACVHREIAKAYRARADKLAVSSPTMATPVV